jgi:predicted ATPase
LSAAAGVKDLRILPDDFGAYELYFEFADRSIPERLVSDGTKWLARCCLELAVAEDVVLIEEPEVHLHPKFLWLCAKAMVETARRGSQIIISTHSLELIDALRSELKQSELDLLSVVRLRLDNGNLLTSQWSGSEVAEARATIAEDLR